MDGMDIERKFNLCAHHETKSLVPAEMFIHGMKGLVLQLDR